MSSLEAVLARSDGTILWKHSSPTGDKSMSKNVNEFKTLVNNYLSDLIAISGTTEENVSSPENDDSDEEEEDDFLKIDNKRRKRSEEDEELNKKLKP